MAAFPLVFLIVDLLNGTETDWGGAAGVGWLLAYVAGLAAARLAIATEYLVADASGVRWRTLFHKRSMPWDRIHGFEISQMSLFPSPVASWDVIVLVTPSGGRRRVRASLWAGDRRRRRWLDQSIGYWMHAVSPRP